MPIDPVTPSEIFGDGTRLPDWVIAAVNQTIREKSESNIVWFTAVDLLSRLADHDPSPERPQIDYAYYVQCRESSHLDFGPAYERAGWQVLIAETLTDFGDRKIWVSAWTMTRAR